MLAGGNVDGLRGNLLPPLPWQALRGYLARFVRDRGRRCYPAQDLIKKIHAMRDAGEDVVLAARTDAASVDGLERRPDNLNRQDSRTC